MYFKSIDEPDTSKGGSGANPLLGFNLLLDLLQLLFALDLGYWFGAGKVCVATKRFESASHLICDSVASPGFCLKPSFKLFCALFVCLAVRRKEIVEGNAQPGSENLSPLRLVHELLVKGGWMPVTIKQAKIFEKLWRRSILGACETKVLQKIHIESFGRACVLNLVQNLWKISGR